MVNSTMSGDGSHRPAPGLQCRRQCTASAAVVDDCLPVNLANCADSGRTRRSVPPPTEQHDDSDRLRPARPTGVAAERFQLEKYRAAAHSRTLRQVAAANSNVMLVSVYVLFVSLARKRMPDAC
jgi:hypothetical protein